MEKIFENKRIATEFYVTYGIERDAEKLKSFMGDYYKQHNPYVQDGAEHFLEFVKFRKEHYPEGRNIIKLTIADEDKVMFHVHSVLEPGKPGRNLVDTFRIENGKIVEHWDVISNLSELQFPPIYEGGLFNKYGDGILQDLDKTEENKQIATDFYNAFANEKDEMKVAGYLGNDFLQHSPHLQDGVDSFMNLVRYRKEQFPEGKNEIKVTVAQGNLVGFHVHSVLVPGELGENIVDIYRIERGKVVEHWGTAQKIELLRFPPINGNGLY